MTIEEESVQFLQDSMDSDFSDPVNIGSDEMVTVNQLAETIMEIAGKKLKINHISGPLGVRGRNSNNNLIYEKLGWKPTRRLQDGLKKTYEWIDEQVKIKQSQVATIWALNHLIGILLLRPIGGGLNFI